MRNKKTKKVLKEVDERVSLVICCDICGTKSDKHGEWCHDVYEKLDTVVRLEYGDIYPCGGSYRRCTIDICPKCFTEKLVPWIKQNNSGFNLYEEEIDV